MRKLTLYLSVIMLLASVMTTFAQDSSKKTPDLPDFKKSPYLDQGKDQTKSILNPELGALVGNLYQDNKDANVASNFIMVFQKTDSKVFYAEWIHVNDDRVSGVLRSYNLKEGVWVLDKEAPIRKE